MEVGVVSRGKYKWALAIACLAAANAEAQSTESSRKWIAIGGAWTTLQGACGEGCDQEGPYRNTGSFLANAGYRVNSRMDTGAEIFWTSTDLAGGDSLRSTFVLGAAQFRPWESKGFSLKAGMGMAFVRNWVYDVSGEGGGPPYTSKALGLTYGAGWTFRHTQRLSVQIFGAQHVATLGDLETSAQTYENVVGNFWSVGATLVIR
jgi:Outer membrane protein beta-barrel domain